MKITRLNPGERPSDEDGRIYIDRLADREFAWAGSVAVGGAAVFGASRNEHATAQEAEAEAIQWAENHGAANLIIEIDNA